MKGFGKLGVAAVALAVGIFGAGFSHATPDDPYTSYTQPANALVLPFDATDGRQSFLLVSNLAGISPTGTDRAIPAVTTHWSYWSETCKHLADVYVCLTLNDTVVVDPTDIRSIDAGNNKYGPDVDLTGERGVVVVTSYSTGEICSDASYEGYLPIDGAIVGSYTLADIDSGAALGGDAIGLGLHYDDHCNPDADVRFIQRLNDPDFDCHTELPKLNTDALEIQTFNPESLDLSAVVFVSLQEKSGSGDGVQDIEVGPRTGAATGSAFFYDNTEAQTSLPDVTIKCVTFNSLIPGDGNLIPDTVSQLTSGIFRLSGLRTQMGGETGRWIYGIYGQSLGQFGAGSNAKYSAQ